SSWASWSSAYSPSPSTCWCATWNAWRSPGRDAYSGAAPAGQSPMAGRPLIFYAGLQTARRRAFAFPGGFMFQAAMLKPVLWESLFQRESATHLSLQGRLRQMLVSAILSGHLPPGAPVPSSRYLADQLGIARNTVV